MRSGPSDSAKPIVTPPAIEPPRLPIPPTTAELKALIPGRKPVVCVILRNSKPQRTPAKPAIAPPTMNTCCIARFTLMPIKAAISGSSATARIALPDLVRSTRYQRTHIDRIAITVASILVPEMPIPGTLSAIHAGGLG